MDQPKSHYNMDNASLTDSANHLLWFLGRMANRMHNATSPASIGEQKADATNICDEAQPLMDALKALGCYRADGQCDLHEPPVPSPLAKHLGSLLRAIAKEGAACD